MHYATFTRRALLATTILAAPAVVMAARVKSLYGDPAQPVDVRVRDLLARMTLEEKVAQLKSIWNGKQKILDAAGNFSAEKAATFLADGIGHIGRPGDTQGTNRGAKTSFRSITDTVALVNDIQRFLVERTRLGIPAMFHDETAHGLAALNATIFPIPPALGSTWDPKLVEAVFAVSGREARLRGTTVALSPVLDLSRDPRFGRVEEFFGEDPYLVAQMGIAAVRGQQGRQRPLGRDKVFSTLKHFVHGVPQGGLNIAPSDVSDRTLRENFLVPFAAVIKNTNPAFIMPSYNEVGGVPAHGNHDLLQNVGRARMGFNGSYISDYGGIPSLIDTHKVVADLDAAALLALNAGVDADLPEGEAFARLPELVRAGKLAEAKIDVAVARILALKFEAGLFENPYADARKAVSGTNTPGDVKLARTVAQKAIVLLKNDGILPLDPKAKTKLAVIGPNAVEPLFGGYSTLNAKAVGVLAGLKAAGVAAQIEYAEGVRIIEPDKTGEHRVYLPIRPVKKSDNEKRIAEAVELAKRSDVIVLVVGDQPETTREAISPRTPGDRNSLGLFGDQDALVDALLATQKPMVALLINGRALSITRLAEGANALVEGWYMGQEGGNAFADILFGRANPGGKLTVSFPRSAGDLPVFYNRHPSANLNQYIEGRKAVLFPFGFGLSYSTFAISDPILAKSSILMGETALVDVEVSNTGKYSGDEVVQLYIRDKVSSVPRPILELKGFRRVSLKPGEKRTIQFELKPDDLAFWNIDMQWLVEPGEFSIAVGANSVALKSATLNVV